MFFLWPAGVILLLFRDVLLPAPGRHVSANTETEVGCFRYDFLGRFSLLHSGKLT